MELLLIATGIFVGILSGFFGIGGGMILVPILMFLGFDIKEAIEISIVQMVFSSMYGSYLNYKKGSLILGEGLWVGVGGFLGGSVGAYVSTLVSSEILGYLFFSLLLFALYRLFASRIKDDGSVKRLNPMILFGIGALIGVFAISLGVGGSILLTPILTSFLHYSIKKAVSAGLFFVAFSSISGLLSHLSIGDINLTQGLYVAIASLVGVYIGIWLKDHVTPSRHKLYLVVMYSTALLILVKKLWF